MDISPQNSYFNYFTTTKIKIIIKINTRRGRRRKHNKKQQ